MWQEIVAKVLSIADKVMEHFTPKQNVIRLKNELREREDEVFKLKHELCTRAKVQRIMWLNGRIADINEILKNHATD
jgi:hypothetical protein